jgi:hypothetical protein
MKSGISGMFSGRIASLFEKHLMDRDASFTNMDVRGRCVAVAARLLP